MLLFFDRVVTGLPVSFWKYLVMQRTWAFMHRWYIASIEENSHRSKFLWFLQLGKYGVALTFVKGNYIFSINVSPGDQLLASAFCYLQTRHAVMVYTNWIFLNLLLINFCFYWCSDDGSWRAHFNIHEIFV